MRPPIDELMMRLAFEERLSHLEKDEAPPYVKELLFGWFRGGIKFAEDYYKPHNSSKIIVDH